MFCSQIAEQAGAQPAGSNMLCLFEITKSGCPRPCKHLVPVSWAFSQQVLCYKTQGWTSMVTSYRGPRTSLLYLGMLPTAAPNTGELRAAGQFPRLVFLNKFLLVSKGINRLIPNAKPNSSSHKKFVSKDEFCSQINHWSTGWTHKKTLRIWIEFKGLAGYVSPGMPVCGRKGQEKPLQKIQIKELSLADKSGCIKDSPSLQSSGFWRYL